MHAALDARKDPRPLDERTLARDAAWPAAATWLPLASLLLAACLPCADGLIGGSVAYERDTSVFYYPLLVWASQQLHATGLPLWAPHIFGGYPIFADGELGLASPPVLLALLFLPPERAFVILRIAHLAVAGLGCYALARTWGLSRPASTLAGLTFTLGSFLQAQVHHENIVRTAVWLPLLLVAVERSLRAQTIASRVRWAVVGGLVLGLAGVSLHWQILAIDLLVLAAYGLFRWWCGPLWAGRAGWRSRAEAIAATFPPVVVLGLGVAAVQIVPLLELARFSARGEGIPYSESAAYSLTPHGLLQLVFPFVFRAQGNLQWGLWTHWESYLYVGLVPLVLAALAVVCVRRREVVGWAVIGGLGVLIALGQYTPLNLHYLIWLLPGMGALRAPGRFTLPVMLAAAMLAAYGLTWLEQRAGRGRPQKGLELVMYACLGAPVYLGGLLVLVHVALLQAPDAARGAIERWYLALPRDSYPLTQTDILGGLLWSTDLIANGRAGLPLLLLALVGGCVFVWQVGPWRRARGWRGWPALLVGLALADLVVFGWSIHPRSSLAGLSAEPPAVAAIRRLDDGQPFRVLGAPVLSQVASNRLAPQGIQDANGYSSLESTWHRDFVTRVFHVDDDLLDAWNVRFVLDPTRYGQLSSHRGVTFLANQALLHAPRASALGDESFRVPRQTPVTQVRWVSALSGGVDISQGTPVGEIELRDAAGALLAAYPLEAGRDVMEWGADDPTVRPFLRHQAVETAGWTREAGRDTNRVLSYGAFSLDPPTAVASVRLRSEAPQGELIVYGLALVDQNGAVQQLFGRTRDKYREVFRDADMTVFENSAALPRAFFVGHARTAPSVGAALDEMLRKPFDPRAEVVLAGDTPADVLASLPVPSAETTPGSAWIDYYAAGATRVRSTTSSDALLVVSDSFYPGWRAFVDGREVAVLRGDVLFRVMPVPAGEHAVDLRFDPASVKVGLLITSVCLLLSVALLAGTRLRRGSRT